MYIFDKQLTNRKSCEGYYSFYLMNNNPIVYRYELLEVFSMNNAKHLNSVLNHTIKTISDSRSLFVLNPETDFTRVRKINFDTQYYAF